jgi:MFS family permease
MGDRRGRKRTFAFSVWLMAVATLGIAITPTFVTIGVAAPVLLLVFRILQGMALGGELPGAWTFISEHVPRRRVGSACGVVMGLLAIGHLIGIFSAVTVYHFFSATDVLAFAWRLPFLLGALLAFTSIFLRRWLIETPVFLNMQRRNELAAELPLKIVLRSHLRGILFSLALGWLFTVVIIVLFEMTPTLLQTVYGIDVNSALEASSVATIFLAASYPISGILADRLGKGLFLATGAPLLAVCVYLFYAWLPTYPNWLFPLYALAGVSASFITGFLPMMVESFPAAVRFTGVAFSYTIAYAVVGGLVPPLIALGLRVDSRAHMYALLLPCAVVFLIGIRLLIGNRAV